jgi:murein L,D-transpeptidase YafK
MPEETVPFPLVYISPGWNPEVIVVQKNIEKLFIYGSQGEKPKPIRTFNVTTGQLGGDKVDEGDLRTPEGIYFSSEKLEGGRLGKEYGVLAFTLDYPNEYDRLQKKKGSGIWIHATNEPLRSLTPKMTRGCVVLSNLSILDVSRYIRLKDTPIVILQDLESASADEADRLRNEVLLFISEWLRSWKNSDMKSYFSFYSDDFQMSGGKGDGKNGKQREIPLFECDESAIEQAIDWILRCKTYLVASVYQVCVVDGGKVLGKRLLYLGREKGSLKIIGERFVPLEPWNKEEPFLPGKDYLRAYAPDSFEGPLKKEDAEISPLEEQKLVEVGNFISQKSVVKANLLRFAFEVGKRNRNVREPLDVRIAFIVRGIDGLGREWYASYPEGVAQRSYFPESFAACRQVSIADSDLIEGEVHLPGRNPMPMTGKICVYRKDGVLLEEKEIGLSAPASGV